MNIDDFQNLLRCRGQKCAYHHRWCHSFQPHQIGHKVQKLFLPGHLGFIFDGRVETCFYYEVSYGPLVGCEIGGVTESHRHPVAITTGAERRGFVTNRGRDWSVATPIPEM